MTSASLLFRAFSHFAKASIFLIGLTLSIRSPASEQRSLDELYAEAMQEGGELTIWAGGDKPDQMDYIKGAFQSKRVF